MMQYCFKIYPNKYCRGIVMLRPENKCCLFKVVVMRNTTASKKVEVEMQHF